MNAKTIAVFLFISLCIACSKTPKSLIETVISEDLAEITAVECKGQPGNYTLDVTIKSPDTGCDQYADWWEVLTPDSTLIYRRILTHSHVTEQPFTRSGGPIDIGENDFVYVRAHMNKAGYGTVVFSGTAAEELTLDSLDSQYAIGLETKEPLPGDCDF